MVILAVLLSVSACSDPSEILESTAIISYSNPQVDGCGYFITINTQEYKPSNPEVIPQKFMQLQQQTIDLKYKSNGTIEYLCGFAGILEGDAIEIIEIK